jgi:hypothetical protein
VKKVQSFDIVRFFFQTSPDLGAALLEGRLQSDQGRLNVWGDGEPRSLASDLQQ